MNKENRLQKVPVVRTMGLELFAPGIREPVLRGTVYATDLLRGSSIHAVSGVLHSQQGAELDFVGQLGGVTFVGKKRPLGRPPKDARNMAVYMAFKWFQAGQKPHKTAETSARRDLLDYWESRWPGMPDESTRDALIRKGEARALEAIGSPGDMVAYRSRCGADGYVLILPPGCIQHHPGDSVRGSGEGLVWRYGEEETQFYGFTFEAGLSHPLESSKAVK